MNRPLQGKSNESGVYEAPTLCSVMQSMLNRMQNESLQDLSLGTKKKKDFLLGWDND